MCLVCSATNTPVCSTGVCQASFWQQNINLLILTMTPVVGGFLLWIKNLIQKVKKK
jgi:hypothetical protein